MISGANLNLAMYLLPTMKNIFILLIFCLQPSWKYQETQLACSARRFPVISSPRNKSHMGNYSSVLWYSFNFTWKTLWKHLSILQKHKSFKIGLSEFESKYEVKKTSILFQADRKLTIWFILHRTELLFIFFFLPLFRFSLILHTLGRFGVKLIKEETVKKTVDQWKCYFFLLILQWMN